MADAVPERPLAELHGKKGQTLMLTARAVRLGGPKDFGSIPIEEVASTHYEANRSGNVARLVGIVAAAIAAFFFLLVFITFDDDFLAIVFPAGFVSIVAFGIGLVSGPRSFVVRSRGGGALSLAIAASRRDDLMSFVEALERAKAQASGKDASASLAPTFEAYAKRR